MGRWNGDTENQHTNKQTQWCAAATCTYFEKPHQNHPFSQLRAARLNLSKRKELNNGALEWGHRKPTRQQAQQQRCADATCTHPQNPHQNHPFSQLRAARLKLSERKELNNGTLEWGHKKPTHQQAATKVRSRNTFTSPKHQPK